MQGLPFIDGYKPLSNYQRLLLPEVVTEALQHRPGIVRFVASEVEEPARVPAVEDILRAMESPPTRGPLTEEPKNHPRSEAPDGVNYLEREARNRSLGDAGEGFVLSCEKARLLFLGKDRLADRIEWVAKTKGDSEGYDVLSFEESGKHRFIEVKTTRYGRCTPFFVSPNELRFCERHQGAYHLYRVFSFKHNPRMFQLSGSIDRHCRLAPTQYRATIV